MHINTIKTHNNLSLQEGRQRCMKCQSQSHGKKPDSCRYRNFRSSKCESITKIQVFV